jgi:hypothetical protein
MSCHWNISINKISGSIWFSTLCSCDILSIWIHLYDLKTKQTCRMTHDLIYDFFMGVWLNPCIRILGQDVDLKMIVEVRLS